MKRFLRSRHVICSKLTEAGIVAVVRAQTAEQLPAITQALIDGGLLAVEFTMTTPGALEAIRHARGLFEDRGLVGVGTVLDAQTCRDALTAGADFVVTPICRTELVRIAHAADRPIMVGAYTPTEAQLAHEAEADFIKLFPADKLGPAYIKSLLAPLPHLRLVPTGGVDADNIADFLKAGCAALGVGSSLVSSEILRNADWPALTKKAAEFVREAQKARA